MSVVIFIIPTLLIIGILIVCQWYRVTMIPKDFRSNRPVKKYKVPKIPIDAFRW